MRGIWKGLKREKGRGKLCSYNLKNKKSNTIQEKHGFLEILNALFQITWEIKNRNKN